MTQLKLEQIQEGRSYRMHIIIRKSSEDSYWYRSLVGETFTVTHMDEENYYVEPPVGWGRTREYGVALEDAEPVEVVQMTMF